MAQIDRLAARIRALETDNALLVTRLKAVEEAFAHVKGVAFADEERPPFPSVEWITKDPPEEATSSDTWIDL